MTKIKKDVWNMKKKQRVLFVLFAVVISLAGCNKQRGSEENDNLLTEFEAVVKNVNENFMYDGYEEIMKNKSVVLALPLEYEKIDEAIDYLALQKLFVYKNVDKDVLILLQITKSAGEENSNSWNHGLSYSPMEYNNPEKGTVVDMPEIEVGAYSFSYEGYNYMSIGMAGIDPEKLDLATTELIGFNNELIRFITESTVE